MPCWTRTEMTLGDHIAPAQEAELTRALEALGFRVAANRYGYRLAADRMRDEVSVTVDAAGRLRVTAADPQADLRPLAAEVRRAYSAEVIKQAARRFHWTLKQPDAQRRTYIAERR